MEIYKSFHVDELNETYRVNEVIVEVRTSVKKVLLTSKIEIEIKELPNRFLF